MPPSDPLNSTGHLSAAQFISSVQPPSDSPSAQTRPALWFLFQAGKLLVREHGQDGETRAAVPYIDSPTVLNLNSLRAQFLGYFGADGDYTNCFCAEIAEDATLPAGYTVDGLRQLAPRLDDVTFNLAGRAVQIVAWDRDNQFCSRCATPLDTLDYERAKKCPVCGLTLYPRLSPAIIIAITRHIDGRDHLLLARNHRFPEGMYSVLAGFVEPGETLEECCEREVREEVGIEITNIRYAASQPWPFPNSLMLGFTADYANGDFVLEAEEIDRAAWFTPDNFPQLPPKLSIARRLIDAFVARPT